jgi:hypothetical protein
LRRRRISVNAFTPHLHAHNSVRATALRTKAMLRIPPTA